MPLPADAVAFRGSLQVSSGDNDYNTPAEVCALANAAPLGVPTLIWQKTVPPQNVYGWGYGQYGAGVERSLGTLTFAMLKKADPLLANGELDFIVNNANNTRQVHIARLSVAPLRKAGVVAANTQAADLLVFDVDQVPPFPFVEPTVERDERLQIFYTKGGGDTAASQAWDDVAFIIPYTIYNI